MVLSSSHLANSLLTLNRKPPIEIVHLYLSPAHNYFGHHGRPAEAHAILEVSEARCVAGRGIEGDRFFDFKESYKGQITFFAWEVYQSLCGEFGVENIPPSVFRRNAITRGVDLNTLIGQPFEIQGVRFEGSEECRPCYWMDEAFHAGAEERMRGRGGLRARILTDGVLRVTAGLVPITACLVAGGKSSRMGRDKAAVELDGSPLWQRQIATLRSLGPAELLISGRPDAPYSDCGARLVQDRVAESGPLAGIAALLRECSQPLAVMLAVDMPRMTASYLHSLRAHCTETCGVVAMNGEFYEPLAAIFPKAALPLAEAALAQDDRSLQRFVLHCAKLGLVRIVPAPEPDAQLFASVNSPSDLPGIA